MHSDPANAPAHVLAIDTTSEFLSLAARRGERPVASIYERRGRAISRDLFAEIDALLADVTPAGLELLVVAVGPGSFTGTRIGMAAAAAFAQVLDIPLIGVDTLHLMAAQTRPPDPPGAEGKRFHVLLNCVRGEIYHAPFRWSGGRPRALAPIAVTEVPRVAEVVGRDPVVLRRFEPADARWDEPLADLLRATLRSPEPDATLLLEEGLRRHAERPSGPFPPPRPIYLKSEAFRKWRPAS